MNSFRDFTKICRVCMSDGSRDIFHKIAPSPIPTTSGTGTSPLDRLLEKLRYVTMMKIEENDDLPRLLCDLCIVQLNVAYNFKRQAVENDTKLRQYFIENGISSSCNNTSGSSNSTNVTINESLQNQSTRSSLTVSNISSMAVNRSFPIVPFIIKTEPSDNDALSDGTTEINLDTNCVERLIPSIQTSTPGRENVSESIDSGIEIFNKDKHNPSVVYINGYGYNNLTPSSDIESVHNNHQTSTMNLSSSGQLRTESTTSNLGLRRPSQYQRQRSQERQQQQKKSDTAIISVVNNLLPEDKNKNKTSPLTTASVKTPKSRENNNISPKTKNPRKGQNELRNLSISMSLPSGEKRKKSIETVRTDGGKNKLSGNEMISSMRKPLKGGIRKDGDKRCKPTRAQKEFIMKMSKVTSSPTSLLQKSNNSDDTLFVKSSKLLINPCSADNSNNETKSRKRRLYNEGRVKEKTFTKFIRPKLEPTGK